MVLEETDSEYILKLKKKDSDIAATQEAIEGVEPIPCKEHEPWDDFNKHVDQSGNRLPPTPEARELMDKSLAALGRLFTGTGLRWQLDGALNISLIRGEYIGLHKDVDISVEAEEMTLLEKKMSERGYGLFLSYSQENDPVGNKILERVNAAAFLVAAESDQTGKHPMIAAVDAEGKVRNDTDLNFIDTHVVRRLDGQPIGWQGIKLPNEWYEPVPQKMQDTEIMLSHPAKVAYFKLHGERNYDATDLKLLAESGKLTLADVDQITQLITAEQQARLDNAAHHYDDFFQRLTPYMQQTEIRQLLSTDTFFGSRTKQAPAEFDELAEVIAHSTQRTFANLRSDIVRIFKADIRFKKEQEKVVELRSWVQTKTT